MRVSNDSIPTQQRAFYGTGSIAGMCVPNFSEPNMFTKTKSGTDEKGFTRAIIQQAQKDFAAGEFQNSSQGYCALQKAYVSTVSPDRKGIIASGMQAIAKSMKNEPDTLTVEEAYLRFLLGEADYSETDGSVSYARFTDANGETVATYSNGGWTMLNTEAENKRMSDMCAIYNRAWAQAKDRSATAAGGLNVSI